MSSSRQRPPEDHSSRDGKGRTITFPFTFEYSCGTTEFGTGAHFPLPVIWKYHGMANKNSDHCALPPAFPVRVCRPGYEIVWTRLFAVGLGHEIPAVLAVVAAFFSGLALGALSRTAG